MTRVILRDGRVAEFRTANNNKEDRELVKGLFQRVSTESLYFRFFHVVREVPESVINNMLGSDDGMNVTLLCMAGDNCLGIGTYNKVDDECAEVAFLVDDEVQGKGIGTLLLEHLADLAWKSGFKRFEAYVLRENYRMIRVFMSSGYEVSSHHESGELTLTLPLSQTERSRALYETREKLATAASLAPFFRPQTVAVVGASRDPNRLGHLLLRHVLNGGFQGTIYPVNPSAHSVAAVRAYPTLADIPEKVDLAIIAVPAEQVPSVVDDCVQSGVRAVIVTSAGFAEHDAKGAELQRQVVHTLRGFGCRMIGPNCLGLVNTDETVGLNASFAPRMPYRGGLAIASQSGALGIALLEYATRIGVGISSFASTGNKADVSGNDLLQYWEDDPETQMIALYLESFGNPRKFSRIARRITQDKPLLVVKSARTSAGIAVSEARHEAIAARDTVVEALFRQTGIIRLDTLPELFDVASLLAFSPLPQGNRVAIVTNTAAAAVMTVDALLKQGLTLVKPPIDLGFQALAEGYRTVLPQVLRDPEVDAVIVLFIPVGISEEAAISKAIVEAIEEVDANPDSVQPGGTPTRKPIVANFLTTSEPMVRFIEAGAQKIPVYPFPEQAVYALSRVMGYAEYRRTPRGHIPDLPGVDCDLARSVIRQVVTNQVSWATTETAVAVMNAIGVDVYTSPMLNIDQGAFLQATITTEFDRLFGTLISLELDGARSVRIAPLTDVDCREMVSSVMQAATLREYNTVAQGGVLQDLLLRVSRLVEEVYEITEVNIWGVEIGKSGYRVHDCAIAAGIRSE